MGTRALIVRRAGRTATPRGEVGRTGPIRSESINARTAIHMNKLLDILIVEDSEEDTLLLLHALRRGNYNPTFERVDGSAAMNAALERRNWDIVVADFSMPQFNA